MQIPKRPKNEEARLAALAALELLDSRAEERFDRITRLACRQFRCKIALISLVDRDRQWFKSARGLSVAETSRDVSFCAHAILEPSLPLVVADAADDPRFSNNPLVIGDPNIRLYAGHPILSPEGLPVGTLCIIDSAARQLSAEDLESLKDLAHIAEDELRAERLTLNELHLREQLASAERRAMVDTLTRVWSRATIFATLVSERDRATRSGRPVGLLMIDIDNFKGVNDTHGHPTGDAVLREVAARMTRALRGMDSLGRYGGEEFLAILPECDAESAVRVAERLRTMVAATPIDAAGRSLEITISVGVALDAPAEGGALEGAIARADRALYEAKHAGRNRVVGPRLTTA